jgi:ribosomal protein L7/L12
VPDLIKNLEHQQFGVREQAVRNLENLERPNAQLEEALETSTSPEARRRLEHVINVLNEKARRERVRAIRSVEILEGIGNKDAKEILQALSKGAEDAVLTQEARLALEHLKERQRD